MDFWINTGMLLAALIFIKLLSRKSFSVRVFAGLVLGILLGVVLTQLLPGQDPAAMASAMPWYNLVGSGYVTLLRMIAIPLIMISILSAIINLETTKGLARRSAAIILILVGTAAIAAVVGIFAAQSFNLRADDIMQGEQEQKRAEYMENRAKADLSLPAQILKVIPSNPFATLR